VTWGERLHEAREVVGGEHDAPTDAPVGRLSRVQRVGGKVGEEEGSAAADALHGGGEVDEVHHTAHASRSSQRVSGILPCLLGVLRRAVAAWDAERLAAGRAAGRTHAREDAGHVQKAALAAYGDAVASNHFRRAVIARAIIPPFDFRDAVKPHRSAVELKPSAAPSFGRDF
jgi:hypothetical protein